MAARVCIFCSKPADSREHLFPDWILRARKDYRPFRMKKDNRTPPRFYGELKVRAVCGDCNTGWMSTLEGEIKPTLGPMMRGEEILLSVCQQEQLSVWALKTAMVTEGYKNASQEHFYSPQDGDNLRLGVSLPKFTNVWIGRLSAAGFHVVSSDVVPDISLTEPRFEGWVSTIVVGYLVFQVASIRPSVELNNVIIGLACNGNWDGLLANIWPPVSPNKVKWPPELTLTTKESDPCSLYAFHRRLENNPPVV